MAIGHGYLPMQILADAIERAGSLDKEKVNDALAQTDLNNISGRIVFDENQFSRLPIADCIWAMA